ncbi:Metallo-peptidase family M12 [Lysobacter sp. yr284]|uniref:M12 family metallo-peptidase n=1 Tax=Lysobacter sp. yr284 TaxID=1761791 RepID=UPI000896FB32|nr:M12 family metallo-peptidase [Lysobacter sp. yr284]SDY42739.1 Metallo-peptidase family M12 [Lysobacter sp. yr284]
MKSLCIAGLLLLTAMPAWATAATAAVSFTGGLDGSRAPASALAGHASRTGRVETRLQALRDSRQSDAAPLELALFADARFDASFVRWIDHGGGRATWVGRIADSQGGGQALLTLSADGVYGRIDAGGAQYVLEGALSGSAVVRQIDPASFASRNLAEGLHQPHPGLVPAKLAAPAQAPVRSGGSASAKSDAEDVLYPVDVLVLYTGRVNQLHGGVAGGPPASALDSYVQNLFADANLSFANSAVHLGGLKRVALLPSSFNEPADAGFDIWNTTHDQMRDSLASFSNLDALRIQYNADVVVLLVDGRRMTATCGRASVPAHQSAFSQWRESVAVVSAGCAAGDRTFTHEIGHILGGLHEGEGGPHPPSKYAQGFVSAAGGFRTIMAIGAGLPGGCTTAGCARINRWSSPYQSYNGHPLGNATADMVEALHWMLPTVSYYSKRGNIAAPGVPQSATIQTCENIGHGPGGEVVITSTTYANWSPAPGLNEFYWLQSSDDPNFSQVIGQPPVYELYRGARTATRIANPSLIKTYTRLRACNNGVGCTAKTVTRLPTSNSCD